MPVQQSNTHQCYSSIRVFNEAGSTLKLQTEVNDAIIILWYICMGACTTFNETQRQVFVTLVGFEVGSSKHISKSGCVGGNTNPGTDLA